MSQVAEHLSEIDVRPLLTQVPTAQGLTVIVGPVPLLHWNSSRCRFENVPAKLCRVEYGRLIRDRAPVTQTLRLPTSIGTSPGIFRGCTSSSARSRVNYVHTVFIVWLNCILSQYTRHDLRRQSAIPKEHGDGAEQL